MWLFTVHGFFSVVRHWRRKGWVTVRARKREHLEDLKSAHLGGKGRIEHTPQRDYAWRMSMDSARWHLLVAAMAIDAEHTDNFKKQAARRMREDPRYLEALHKVWAAMAELQRQDAQDTRVAETLIEKCKREGMQIGGRR